MDPLAPTEENIRRFVTRELILFKDKHQFTKLPPGSKLGFVFGYLIGPETDRFAAEPVLARTGVGKLASKGVDGLKREQELDHSIRHGELRESALGFIKAVEDSISREPSPA